VAKLKAEFLQHYYDANGVPMRAKLIAGFSKSAKLGAIAPGLYNFAVTNPVIGKWIKQFSGFAVERSMPTMYKTTLHSWYKKKAKVATSAASSKAARRVYLFCDEFTNYNDTEIGIKAIQLLEKLGYEVVIPEHIESGRTWLSKGLLRKAKEIVNKNISLLHSIITEETPLIGIEPSAILTFRDEYIDLATDEQLEKARQLAKHVFTFEEFIGREIEKGAIRKEQFTTEKRVIQLHGHCQQKALSSVTHSAKMMSLPENYSVQTIPSGCCGMAGSFGFEKEHYELSMKIGELVLFPTVRRQPDDVIIAAPGTSCRHQVKDGTGKHALHPVEVLYDALA
jgi:Fe-S oxidoreductase